MTGTHRQVAVLSPGFIKLVSFCQDFNVEAIPHEGWEVPGHLVLPLNFQVVAKDLHVQIKLSQQHIKYRTRTLSRLKEGKSTYTLVQIAP